MKVTNPISLGLMSWVIFLSSLFSLKAGAQTTALDLPDVLQMNDGSKITSKAQWLKHRKELIEFFTTEMYGHSPERPVDMRFRVFEVDNNALGGKATRKQVTVLFNGKEDGAQMDLLIYLPNQINHPVPVIVGLNFSGNHSVSADTAIRISKAFMAGTKDSIIIRGKNQSQWPIEKILSHGYGLVTMYREEVAADNVKDSFKKGVHTLYPALQNRQDNFATVAAWAWSLSRALDYLQTDKAVDAKKVVAFGFSRLGKAALWAGAVDERFAMVISNESGAGGAKLFHRNTGENITRLNTVFPYWFCNNFRKYSGKDSILPFDQHMVVSLVAPRPVYIASAEDDKNSDPQGEFESAKAATPVYRLLGTDGLPAETIPALNTSVHGQIAYHIRTGGHDVKDFDWEQYLAFIDKHFGKKQ